MLLHFKTTENIVIRAEHLHGLLGTLPTAAAQELLFAIMDDLETTLTTAQNAASCGNDELLWQQCIELSKLADQLGLTTLGSVARMLSGKIGSHDYPAIGALSKRLQRVGHAALNSIWGVQNALG